LKEARAEESHNHQRKNKNPTNNSFEALNRLQEVEEVENPDKTAGKDPKKYKED
jgi:hypothetical protein